MEKKTVRIFKNSKAKSLDTKQLPENIKHNKSLDFLNLYKSESETSAILARSKSNKSMIIENSKSAPLPDKVQKKNKKNDTLELSQIDIDGMSLNLAGITSTPNTIKGKPSVKSIMKNSSAIMEDSVDIVPEYTPTGNRKKRNKSVSFRLDDEQATFIKKSKSDTTADTSKAKYKNKNLKNDGAQSEPTENIKKERTKPRKSKNRKEEEKENNISNTLMDVSRSETLKPTDIEVSKVAASDNNTNIIPPAITDNHMNKKKKPAKNSRKDSKPDSTDNNGNNNNNSSEQKNNKKKKRHLKQNENTQVAENDTNGEPKKKNPKKDLKPEKIANKLENLKIGDNPHTLTDLLDDMTVVDKNKKKNTKNKIKNGKNGKKPVDTPTETGDLEEIQEGKEKVVWKKRKWNKDKKSDIVGEGLLTSVIVENLPVSIMPEYRKLLTEHFSSLGLIKNIGPPEVITNEDEKFTTTITFYSEGAASEALQLSNTQVGGAAVRVRRPLPPSQTTVVVRSYGALTDRALADAFAAVGRLRVVKHLIKGKKSMATAFVEFDGPESATRALKVAEDARVGGKKIYVSRYELRRSKAADTTQPGQPAGGAVPVSKPKPQSAVASPAARNQESTSDSSDEG